MNAVDVVPNGTSRRSSLLRRKGRSAWIFTPVAWAVAAFNLAVLAWMVLGSLKTTRELMFQPFALPKTLQWRNYADAWDVGGFGQGVFNSLFLVFVSGVGCILVSAPAAYALSRFRSRWAPSMTLMFVMGLGIPHQTLFIPLYLAFYRLGLVDSIFGLALLYTGTGVPFAVFLLTAFFRNLPDELEEAAALDGAGPWLTFWRIMLPQARSGLVTIFVLQAIGHWGETLFALVMLQTKSTVSLAMYQFAQTMQYTGGRYSVLFAGLTIVVLPLFVIYLVLGKRIVDGMAAGYSR